MNIKRAYKSLRRKFRLLYNFPKKLCNTVYYALLNKEKVLVDNAPIFQFINHIRSFNIGDDLNFYLLGELSGKHVIASWSFYHRSIPNVMAIGSIIEWLGNKDSIVWGSGILMPTSSQLSNNWKYKISHVAAVRGKKTRDCLIQAGIECPQVYGDPALLLPLIYSPKSKKEKSRIGIIPHYKDIDNPNVKRLLVEANGNAILISVQKYKNWKDIIDIIFTCDFVISSSLHGLILSDAYGVPNVWATFSELLAGGRFKFEDYYSAVGKEGFEVKVSDITSLNDILAYKNQYHNIIYDPLPLLEACPFEIVHPHVLKYLRKS